MWQWVPAAIAAVASYLGSKKTNDTNVQLAEGNEQFQANMSGTSYQRGVADMQAAGLNPMLAYSQGGASTPMGTMPQINNALGAGVSSGMQAYQTTAAVNQMRQQNEQSEAQTDLIKSQAERNRAETLEKGVTTAEAYSRVYKNRSGAQLDVARTGGAEAESNRSHMKYVAEYGPAHEDYGNVGPTSAFAAAVQKLRAEAKSAELGLSEDEARSKFYRSKLGESSPYLRPLLEILKGITSARGAMR